METVSGAVWARTLLALAAVSGLSLVGAAALLVRRETLNRILFLLISFAAGALLGDAFLHIVPEVAESEAGFDLLASFSILSGVLVFFVLEKVLHWHHAHMPHEEVLHPVAVSNLVGDALHNFVDGAIVAGAFISSTELGIATAVAVALHEIPQEMGDLGILIHAGLKPRRALALNFASALAAVAGGVLTLMFASVAGIERVLLPFTAGAFVYIASTDLFPELHKEPEPRKSAVQVLAILAGVAVMAALLVLE
jgi:zinc and cadmium transporter